MTDIKCPCVNCITLGICKASIKKTVPLFDTLGDRCSIFHDVYFKNKVPQNKCIDILLELFRPYLFKKHGGIMATPEYQYKEPDCCGNCFHGRSSKHTHWCMNPKQLKLPGNPAEPGSGYFTTNTLYVKSYGKCKLYSREV